MGTSPGRPSRTFGPTLATHRPPWAALSWNTRWASMRPFAAALGLALLATLLFVHLDGTPRTWFDEGSHLHVPKTLVQTGHYADRSSEGFRAFGPTVGVGPTVMLPIAAVLRVVGISLLAARLVIAAYLLIALTAFAFLMWRVGGERIMWLATLFLLTASGLQFITTGRQVLGEVPAFAYVLCGFLVWFSHNDDNDAAGLTLTTCSKRCFAAGLLFGLAVVTKSQLGIVLVPAFLGLLALGQWWDRRIGRKQVLIPLIVMLVVFAFWELALLTVVTGGSLAENLALLRQASGGSLIVIAPSRMLTAIRFLFGPHAYFAFLVPALAYATLRAVRRTMSVAELTMLVIALVGFTWFVAASVAWPRYAFVPLALAALPIARLTDAALRALGKRRDTGRYLASVGVGIVAMLLALSFAGQLRATFATPDDAPERMAAYLNATLPEGTVIETWEPELGFLTNHQYHYPAPSFLDLSVRHQWFGTAPIAGYDVHAGGATYLLIGPFARYTGIYDEAARAAQDQQIVTVGDYTLYRLTR